MKRSCLLFFHALLASVFALLTWQCSWEKTAVPTVQAVVTDADGNKQGFVYYIRGRCIETADAYGKKSYYAYNVKNQILTSIPFLPDSLRKTD